MTISREEYNRQCIDLVKKCSEINDEWGLLSHKDFQFRQVSIDDRLPGAEVLGQCNQLMLTKKEFKLFNDQVYNYDYTVIYSESYQVPMMYFNISDQNSPTLFTTVQYADGCPIKLDDGITISNILARNKDLESVINQVEHPFLFRPFYLIHPCRTSEFMQEIYNEYQREQHYLITWLSTVANLIGLKIDHRLSENIETIHVKDK